jgi:hypothetical protein
MKNELENNLLMFFFSSLLKGGGLNLTDKIWRMTLKNNNFINYFK